MNTHPGDKSLPPASSAATPARPTSSTTSRHPQRSRRRHSLSFSFPPLFQPSSPSTSSTSLIPSTAEGRPIPLDDDIAAHRTSALREFNRDYPSRHRYAKSTGAQNSTYSQPVIVRTYSGPSSRPASGTRGGRPASTTSRLKYPFSTGAPTSTSARNGGPGLLSSSMVRTKHLSKNRKGGSSAAHEPAKLPPVDAFSFKSFMTDVNLQNDISTDLDRIAEICARSRYSLSNQYEVHMAPHGSGAEFLASAGRSGRGGNRAVGPTLQAVSSDDERGHRKRRSAGRRRSVAYGTLETIMSSSRSNSEEDKHKKKKGAAELADEVRGRATRKEMAGTGDASSGNESSKQAQTQHTETRHGTSSTKFAKRKSASFANAIIDSSRHHIPPVSATPGDVPQDITSPRSSAGALHSDPALPQTSTSHLEIRTTPDHNGNGVYMHESQPQSPAGSDHDPLFLAHLEEPTRHNAGLLSGFSSWIPWGGVERTTSYSGSRNGAEGSLRELLRYSESKGKGKSIDRT